MQTYAGRANAVTVVGAYRRDRSTTECAYLVVALYRWRRTSASIHYSLGDQCYASDSQNWNYNDGIESQETGTCDYPTADSFWSSAPIKLDHSNASDYLSGSGWVPWEYTAKVSAWWVHQPYSAWQDKYACYSIYWYL
jgi:hypothetical protein